MTYLPQEVVSRTYLRRWWDLPTSGGGVTYLPQEVVGLTYLRR